MPFGTTYGASFKIYPNLNAQAEEAVSYSQESGTYDPNAIYYRKSEDDFIEIGQISEATYNGYHSASITLYKLTKILAKLGLDDDKIDEIVDEVLEATSEEGAPEGVNPEEIAPAPIEEEPTEVVEETTPTEEPQELPPELPPEEVVEDPAPGSVDEVVNNFAQEVAPQEEVAPTPDQPLPTPIADPRIDELVAQLEEQKKANEGLVARITSLEDALKKAGVIEGSPSIGDERPTLPNSINDQGDILGDVLKQLNGR